MHIGRLYGPIFLTPRPTTDPLSGNDTIGKCAESITLSTFRCSFGINSPVPQLVNGDLGPEGTNYASDVVHAWSSAQCHNFTSSENKWNSATCEPLLLQHPIKKDRTALYTYPADPVPLEYYIVGNDVLTENDMMRRNVLLSLVSPSITNSLSRLIGWYSVRSLSVKYPTEVSIM